MCVPEIQERFNLTIIWQKSQIPIMSQIRKKSLSTDIINRGLVGLKNRDFIL